MLARGGGDVARRDDSQSQHYDHPTRVRLDLTACNLLAQSAWRAYALVQLLLTRPCTHAYTRTRHTNYHQLGGLQPGGAQRRRIRGQQRIIARGQESQGRRLNAQANVHAQPNCYNPLPHPSPCSRTAPTPCDSEFERRRARRIECIKKTLQARASAWDWEST